MRKLIKDLAHNLSIIHLMDQDFKVAWVYATRLDKSRKSWENRMRLWGWLFTDPCAITNWAENEKDFQRSMNSRWLNRK